MQEKKPRTYDGEACVIICVFLINFMAMLFIDTISYKDGVAKCKDRTQNSTVPGGAIAAAVTVVMIPIYFVIVCYHSGKVESLYRKIDELEKEVKFEKIALELI